MRTFDERDGQRAQHEHSEDLAPCVEAAAVLAARLWNAAQAEHAGKQSSRNRDLKDCFLFCFGIGRFPAHVKAQSGVIEGG